MKPFYPAKSILLLLCFSLVNIIVFCQNFHLVKDINASTDAFPTNTYLENSVFAQLNGVSYFAVQGEIGLWRSDGTAAGTYVVKAGISPLNIIATNNKIFFKTSGDVGLWVSDGTTAGTQLVLNSVPAISENFSPQSMAAVGSELFFSIYNPSTGNQLWKSDGTAGDTKLLKNFNLIDFASGATSLAYFTGIQNKLYFSAYAITNSQNAFRLWVSDGSEVGTYQINDSIVEPNQVAEGNDGKVYFTGGNKSSGPRYLWTAFGQPVQAQLVVGSTPIDPYPTSGWYRPVVKSSGMIFFISSGSQILYQFNTNSGTGVVPFKTVTGRTPDGRGSYIHNIVDVNGVLFFDLFDATIDKYQLWKINSVGSAELVKDNLPSANHYNANGVLYFAASQQNTGYELWKSDGTSAGTVLVKDINTGQNNSVPSAITYIGNKVVFSANDGISGNELWFSDGSAANTLIVKDINTIATSGSNPNYFMPLGNQMMLLANEGKGGVNWRLWKSDGTDAGTKQVTDNVIIDPKGVSTALAKKGQDTYFFGAAVNTPLGLFKSDGTTEGTTLIKDFSGVGFSLSNFVPSDSIVFFMGFNSTSGVYELWRSDGSADGTFVLKSDFGYSTPYFQSAKTTLYFLVDRTLWKTDGSIAGTQQVKTFNGYIRNLTPVDNLLYFSSDTYSEQGIWKTDGTSDGTILVITQGLNVSKMAAANGQLYATAGAVFDGIGYELYKVGAAGASLELVKDIYPGNSSSEPAYLTGVGDKLYFYAKDGIHGDPYALWRSDGSADGTVYLGGAGKGIGFRQIKSVGDIVYATFPDTTLWRSDGTPEGTFNVQDGSIGMKKTAVPISATDNNLFFTGITAKFGTELYVANGKNSTNGLTFCPPMASATIEAGLQGGIYQWQVGDSINFKNIADTGVYTGTNTAALHFTNLPSSYNGQQFRCKVDNGYSSTYTVQFKNNWNGTVNAVWGNSSNWDCGSLPDANTDVVVSAGTVVVASNVSIKSLSLKPGVIFTVQPGYTLTINGKTIQ